VLVALGYGTFRCIRRMQAKEEAGTNVIASTPAISTLPSTINRGTPKKFSSKPSLHPTSANWGFYYGKQQKTISKFYEKKKENDSGQEEKNEATSPSVATTASKGAPTRVVPLAHVVEKTDVHNYQGMTVTKWMQENPNDAAALTPKDTTLKVLSKVTFSLNQASVAKELAVGIGSTSQLTRVRVLWPR
jgi:hypothetical protein